MFLILGSLWVGMFCGKIDPLSAVEQSGPFMPQIRPRKTGMKSIRGHGRRQAARVRREMNASTKKLAECVEGVDRLAEIAILVPPVSPGLVRMPTGWIRL